MQTGQSNMHMADAKKLAKKFGGWWEGDTVRFPSVFQKEQFMAALSSEQGK